MRKQFRTSFLFILSILFLHFYANAQDEIAEKKINKSGYLNYLRADLKVSKLKFSKDALYSLVKFTKGTELRLLKSETDDLGFDHEYYNLYYNNIRMLGFSYAIHGKNGLLHTVMGNYEDPVNAPIEATISGKEALNIALKTINAKKYIWEDKAMEDALKKSNNDPKASYYPQAELLIIPEYNNSSFLSFKLCYRFEITAVEPFICEFVYIDAVSKKLYKRVSKMHHANDVQATAQTRYSGTQTIWTNFHTFNPSIYSLYETNISGHKVHTMNNNNSMIVGGSNSTNFSDQDNNWTAAEWNNSSGDNVALDIHWAAEKSHEYFKTIFNREGYTGNADAVTSNYVHYRFDGAVTQAQAGYISFKSGHNIGAFVFGNGDVSHNQMGSLDIYAHEYAHGLWDFTVGNADNVYDIVKEWGALQEGVSNAWAAAIEAWAAPTKNHWLVGEEVTYSGLGDYNLANPNLSSQPDTYHGY